MNPAPQCVTCGLEMSGPYCAGCGEAAGHHDYSLKHFAEDALETIAHVDGRVFASFRRLITRPGLLTRQFLAGRRKPQMGPVQLFFVCNLIYFLIQPFTLFVPFTSTLRVQTEERPWHHMAERMVAAKIAARHMPAEEFERSFNEAAHLEGKSLVFLMVPIFALGTWALYAGARRFYAEHLVFGFYLFAGLMLWMAISTLALSPGVRYALDHDWPNIENVFSAAIAVPFVVYLFAALRGAYDEPLWRTALKTLLLSGWLAAVLTAYRFVLFFTSLYAT